MPVLRSYTNADLEQLVTMDAACFAAEFLFDRESMRHFAEARNALTFVAEAEDRILIGFVITHLEGRGAEKRGYLVTLDVAPAHRRAGVARSLLQTTEDHASASGARRMELHVSVANEAAMRFYEKQDYRRIGLEEAFYGAAGRDAYVYRKKLQIPPRP